MKVVLAGTENIPFFKLAAIVGTKNVLFSYFHLKKINFEAQQKLFALMNDYGCETICDSGLFTLMFGVGKGGNYDMEFMRNYAKEYISKAKKFGLNSVNIVECDVHKILGMKEVFELRKQFEDSGLGVIYTWHREEGIEGLFKMAEKYDYIALSVPELRKLFKESKLRYQDGVKDLLSQIKRNVGKIPKIHLLGNTIQETMETDMAYSCDSTSWLSGGRFGRGLYFDGRNLKNISIYDEKFVGVKQHIKKMYPELNDYLLQQYEKEKTQNYMTVHACGAWSFRRYQDWLDRNYTWVGQNGNKR